jgi:phosphoglycerol transferase MdoB-like AlkP superfamily enzyme
MKLTQLLTKYNLLRFCREYFLISLALYLAASLGRLYEMVLLLAYHSPEILNISYFVGALIHDLQFTLITALPLWILYHGIKHFYRKYELTFTTITITVLGIANVILVTYFNATLTPLGSEFWAYSLSEMSNTVLASEQINIWDILILVVFTLLLYRPVKGILHLNLSRRTKKHFRWLLPLSGLILFLPPSWLVFDQQAANTEYQSNKLAYFVISGFESALPAGTDTDYASIEKEYPFLRAASVQSTLAPFFEDFSKPPNIVFLIVESLGGEFVGSSGQWGGFAPNIDSLARSGLYWENGLSLSGRTFGLMPSLFGSLPPGGNGFMELGPNYPHHKTLISLLDEHGYRTSFFSGFNTYFDKLDFFLTYQGIDFKLNKQKIKEQYPLTSKAETENYWGYDDKTMLGIASSILDTARSFPRLDIYHTLQSHSPFTVPNSQQYDKKFDDVVNTLNVTDEREESFRQYRAELTTLLYADEAVGAFMEAYRNRPHYENTIFVITGDHWLIPVPMTSRISRYHVPIIIYSPLLKEAVHFKSVNTHANLTPGLITLLKQKTAMSIPDSVHWIGSTMDTARTFRNIHSVPLMKNKNRLNDYLYNNFYLSDDRLFRLEKGLRLAARENEEVKSQIQEKLRQFKAKNLYAVTKNRLYPGTSSGKITDRYAFLTTYDTLFARIDSIGLNADQQFQQARQLAFDGEYKKARAIAKRLLLEYPDYNDVQLLVGRTHAWQGNYNQARTTFNRVLKKGSTYYDTYNALFDVEYWDGNTKAALKVINKGLEYHPAREQFLEKKIRALSALERTTEARQVYSKLQEHHPNSDILKKLRSLFIE